MNNVLTTRDAPRRALWTAQQAGHLERIARGIYRRADALIAPGVRPVEPAKPSD